MKKQLLMNKNLIFWKFLLPKLPKIYVNLEIWTSTDTDNLLLKNNYDNNANRYGSLYHVSEKRKKKQNLCLM